MTYDMLVHNGTVVTANAAGDVLGDGWVAIQDGRIARVASRAERVALPPALETIDAGGGIVLPGLVNTHTHLPMSLFRGLADDLPLDVWLQAHMFPAEAAHIDPESVWTGTLLACAEMLLSGTTTVCDGYFHEERVAAAVATTGMRAVLGQGVIDFPAPGVPDPAGNVAAAAAFADRWRDASPLIRPSIFCHAPYTCSAATLVKAKAAATDRGLLFQIHAAETRNEMSRVDPARGPSVIDYLDGLGILDGDTLLVHAVWVDPREIELLARRGVPVSHNPESNMKLASGIAPVPDFLAAGLTVGLGTDGCASNNDLDMLAEMDTAAKLHKAARRDPQVMDAQTVLLMATRQGAQAIGLGAHTGSLEAGKAADLIVVDTRRPHLTPLYNPISHLVYAAHGADVRHVLVAGRVCVRDGRLTTIDLESVLRDARRLGRKVRRGGAVC